MEATRDCFSFRVVSARHNRERERERERGREPLVETDFTIDSNYSFVLLHDSTPNSTPSSGTPHPWTTILSSSLFSPFIGVSRTPSSMQETTAGFSRAYYADMTNTAATSPYMAITHLMPLVFNAAVARLVSRALP